MMTITVKYEGNCKKCAAVLAVGSQASYERSSGIFCVPCTPSDPEEIRAFRQEKADAKADRYEEWAMKRRQKAQALHKRNEPYRGDIAFNTQPGYIPERARAIARTERAFEHSATAERFEAKAESLRHVRVAGDAERAREARREKTRGWIKVGMRVVSPLMGEGTVKRINKKTATIINCGCSRNATANEDLSWLTPVAQ